MAFLLVAPTAISAKLKLKDDWDTRPAIQPNEPLKFVQDDKPNIVYHPHPMSEFSNHDLKENETHATALELCPSDKFKAAAAILDKEVPGAMKKVGGLDGLTKHYVQMASKGHRTCLKGPMAGRVDMLEYWPESKEDHPENLIFNLAEGTTGTRSMDCVMEELGFKNRHGFQCDQDNLDCTKSYDNYEYVSDTPLVSHTNQLLATHPHSPAFLTTRDPEDWLRHRLGNIAHHTQPESGAINFADADNFRMGAPCGVEQTLMTSNQNALFGRLMMDSWTVCMASMRNGRQPSDLWLINLFKAKKHNATLTTEEGNEIVVNSLWEFTQKNKVLQRKIKSKEQVADAIDKCH